MIVLCSSALFKMNDSGHAFGGDEQVRGFDWAAVDDKASQKRVAVPAVTRGVGAKCAGISVVACQPF
jgi:hypothetical protein